MTSFVWQPAFVAIMVVIVEGICSWSKKTFWPNHKGGPVIKLPFVYHGGVIVGDLIILPYLFGIWWQYFHVKVLDWAILLVVSVIITWIAHRAWWFMCAEQPGFMYPDRSESEGDEDLWYRDLPSSAWVHFVYMTGALMMIGAYIFTPMPEEIIYKTFWALIVFVPVAVIEPGIVQGWPVKKVDVFAQLSVNFFLWGLIGGITHLKINHLWIDILGGK
ncbi:MAG TPA: hypothetical protein VF817_04175 [Patescibacteria group bacterium]